VPVSVGRRTGPRPNGACRAVAACRSHAGDGPEGQTLTGRLKGTTVEVSMASDADLVLSPLLSKAIDEIDKDTNRYLGW
jgi:hypothetical protein